MQPTRLLKQKLGRSLENPNSRAFDFSNRQIPADMLVYLTLIGETPKWLTPHAAHDAPHLTHKDQNEAPVID
jgi:hypothetical protein